MQQPFIISIVPAKTAGVEQKAGSKVMTVQEPLRREHTVNSPFQFFNPGSVSPLDQGRSASATLLCFSHLRWDFVFQRPQHLLGHAAVSYRVYYIEEPDFAPVSPHFRMKIAQSGVTVLTPVFDHTADHAHETRTLVKSLQSSLGGSPQVHWFYTPMAMKFAGDLDCDLRVYDCMDELSAFRFAPPDLVKMEEELLSSAKLVFTGGQSLFAVKRQRHPDVHLFPSSVDVAHFGRARTPLPDPQDQAAIASPRIGYFGVIDERMDLAMVDHAAHEMPDVQFVMLGPVTKIEPQNLPRRANIHWLGRKDYAELPAYIANWQAAWMPFALNDSTRFISPTKTPEFLAAGRQVTATAIADVVTPYGKQGMVRIADINSVVAALRESLLPPAPEWQRSVDQCLAAMSWHDTWARMQGLMASRTRVISRVLEGV